MGKRYTAVITITETTESSTEMSPHSRKPELVKAEKATSEISRMVVRAKTLTGLSKRIEKVSGLVMEDEDE